MAAARRLRSTYCSLAHGRVLHEQFGEPVREIALGVLPDASFNDLDADLREVLVVGRPIAAS